MALTDSFVLPAGSVLKPVSELSAALRQNAAAEDGDFILSRPNTRTHSKVIDAQAASLIRQFEKPNTIARAVARFSRGEAATAERLLEEALPMLQSLIEAHLLVEVDSVEAGQIAPSFAADESIDGWVVVQCVQMLNDSELYQVRTPEGQHAALKIGRPGHDHVRYAIAWESRILARIDARVTPRLLGTGESNGRPYAAVEWIQGVDAQTVCAEFRQRNDAEARREMIRLTGAILEAYAHLHEQGVIHGDVHPRNVLIDSHQSARIIDLGLARQVGANGQGDIVQRGGVSFFFEPEFALAAMNNVLPPQSSFAGEQHALGALLYLLLTGSHYLNFSLEKMEMLRQIATEPMVPFVQRGIEPWNEVETLLARALSKDAGARFASTREFAREWGSIKVATTTSRPATDPKLRSVRLEFLRRSALEGPLMNGEPLPAPTTSLNYGSAGLAFALYRMACASDDAEMLARADVWSARACREIKNEGAFYNSKIDITLQTVGTNSLYHSPAGVYAVQALIAESRDDLGSQIAATDAFLEASMKSSEFLDLTLGRAGTLLGCVFLLDALKDQHAMIPVTEERRKLQDFGHHLYAQLWHTVDGYAPIRESKELSNLGIAHGWAGLLYTTLCWCAGAKEPLPTSLAERLQQLSESAEPIGRGLHWKWDLATKANSTATASMPGWCNGSAGFVFLWTEAYKATAERKYLELAEGAAWNVWETPSPIGTLCCGMAGQAYALLNLYRNTGETSWLRRAQDAARWAAIASTGSGNSRNPEYRPEGLYKGDFAVAMLDLDLQRPEEARMPMFERQV